MRDDGRMSSQVDYTRDSVNEKLTGTTEQLLTYRSRSGEESRPRGSNGLDITSPSTVSSDSCSNGHNRGDSSVQLREPAPAVSSPGFFAPPSTPAPHYGFRRNNANATTASRRMSHRSSSAPGLGGDDRRSEQETLLPTADGAQLPGSRSAGSYTADADNRYNDATGRVSRDARRGGGGGLDSAFTSSTAPGTLPSSSGNAFKYNNLLKYGGDRAFQMNDDEVAAALLGGTSSVAGEVDRRAGYRYPVLGSKTRSESAPMATKTGSSSPPMPSLNLARLDPQPPSSVEAPAAAAPAPSPALASAEPKPRRKKKGGKDEKKRGHHSSRSSRTSSSGGLRGGNGEAASQPMASSSSAWFAGMTVAQQDRFESLQERSSAGHELARWKMLELMRHWMCAQGTRSSVDAVIREVLADAGLAKVKEAWGSSGGGSVSAVRTAPTSSQANEGEEAAGATAATPPTSEPRFDKVSPKSQLIAKMAIPAAPDDPVPAAAAQATPSAQADVKEVAGDKAMKDASRAAVGEIAAVALPALVESITTNVGGAASSSTAEAPSSAPLVDPAPGCTAQQSPFVSPQRRQYKKDKALATAEEEEKEEGEAEQRQLTPPTQAALLREGEGTNGKKVSKNEGELPPINATPERQVTPASRDGNGVCAEAAAAPQRADCSADRAAAAVRPLGEFTTPQRTPSETPLRSPKVADIAVRRSRSRSRSSSLKEAAARREAATYEEIPRFYFPLGRPTTHEQIINGPLSKKHENPHLKVVDGMAIAAAMYDGEENSMLSANASALAGDSSEGAGTPIETRRGPKVAPMSNLHILEDRQVAHYIQREFGRLPPFPKHSSRVRLLSGRVRSGSHNNGNLPYAKQELLYKQQFIQCVQRICNQCFGVPRYFAFIVLRLILLEVNNGAADVSGEGGRQQSRPASSSRMGSSSSLLSHTTNASSGASSSTLPSLFHVTPQHLKDFYDAHLRNKDAVRRVFDLLILSSQLPNSAAAAASLAATNAAAAAAAATADQRQADTSTPRSLETAPLRSYLLPQDFVAYIDVLLTQHPGLTFLRQTPDFQTKYLDTVIYRIYYELDRFDRGSIHYSELAASRLIDAFRQVDAAEDINSVLLFFSYEHFYVLYCRFWELDEDRDMLLAPEDLMRYAPEDVMNPAIVQRVFAGVGRRLRCSVPQRIGYEDFVWFCLSEEDKSTPQAIRYWFRVLDLDGDGVLSVYELREFYDATRDKIAQYVQEGLVTFENVVCQVFDMLRCPEYRGLHLSDLMREPEAAAVALNMLTNVVKFLQFEQRDPFVSHQERLLGGLEQSAWDRFARLVYDRMALETDEED